jgi:hypothetical protein
MQAKRSEGGRSDSTADPTLLLALVQLATALTRGSGLSRLEPFSGLYDEHFAQLWCNDETAPTRRSPPCAQVNLALNAVAAAGARSFAPLMKYTNTSRGVTFAATDPRTLVRLAGCPPRAHVRAQSTQAAMAAAE